MDADKSRLTLAYAPPLDWTFFLHDFSTRLTPGVELVTRERYPERLSSIPVRTRFTPDLENTPSPCEKTATPCESECDAKSTPTSRQIRLPRVLGVPLGLIAARFCRLLSAASYRIRLTCARVLRLRVRLAYVEREHKLIG